MPMRASLFWPPDIRPVELVVAAARVGADDDARNAGQLAPQVERDLIARALALVLRHEEQLNEAAARAAAAKAAAATAAAAPALAMIVSASGTSCCVICSSRLMMASVRSMRVPGGELSRHLDDAFVGLRRQLGVQQREHQHGRDDRRDANRDHDRTMHERLVQEPPIRVVHPFEEVLAPREQAAADPVRSSLRAAAASAGARTAPAPA